MNDTVLNLIRTSVLDKFLGEEPPYHYYAAAKALHEMCRIIRDLPDEALEDVDKFVDCFEI